MVVYLCQTNTCLKWFCIVTFYVDISYVIYKVPCNRQTFKKISNDILCKLFLKKNNAWNLKFLYYVF